MRIRLRSLFLIIAVFALLSAWLAKRQTPRFAGALIQLVQAATSGDSISTRDAFEEELYGELVAELNRSHPEIMRDMAEPEKQIRDSIRIERAVKDDRTQLVAIHAWGNPLTGDDESLKTILKSAIDSLQSLSKDKTRGQRIKILNLPKL